MPSNNRHVQAETIATGGEFLLVTRVSADDDVKERETQTEFQDGHKLQPEDQKQMMRRLWNSQVQQQNQALQMIKLMEQIWNAVLAFNIVLFPCVFHMVLKNQGMELLKDYDVPQLYQNMLTVVMITSLMVGIPVCMYLLSAVEGTLNDMRMRVEDNKLDPVFLKDLDDKDDDVTEDGEEDKDIKEEEDESPDDESDDSNVEAESSI